MSNSKHQHPRTAVGKALLLAGLITVVSPVWSIEVGLNHSDLISDSNSGASHELEGATPLLQEILPFFPAEGKVRDALLAHPKVREARLMSSTKQVEADINQGSPDRKSVV